jgi:hypothetical protein
MFSVGSGSAVGASAHSLFYYCTALPSARRHFLGFRYLGFGISNLLFYLPFYFSPCTDIYSKIARNYWGVAQLARAADFGSACRGFKSLHPCHSADSGHGWLIVNIFSYR